MFSLTRESALGHVRLEINDLTPTGGQPLHHYIGHDSHHLASGGSPPDHVSDPCLPHQADHPPSTAKVNANGIHAVVNGELYPYTLRTDLAYHPTSNPEGYKFRSTSDSELVLALYQRYGLSSGFFENLRGEYSFVLYDEERGLVLLVRDRYGIKPLFYTVQDVRATGVNEEGMVEGTEMGRGNVGGEEEAEMGIGEHRELWIAAEQKAFRAHGWEPEWDVDAIVSGAWQLGERTLFKGVRKVEPGCYVVVHLDGTDGVVGDRNDNRGAVREKSADDGGGGGTGIGVDDGGPIEIQRHRYWDQSYPDNATPDPRSVPEMITQTRALLLDAIRVRLRADVPVGISLSGGLDSSIVAGMTAHLLRTEGGTTTAGSQSPTERLRCFGIGFDADSGFDESVEARKTAEWLGVSFEARVMDERSLVEMFEDAVWVGEGVNPDLNFVGVYALSELFRAAGVRVNVNGQGADEGCGGYDIFVPDRLRAQCGGGIDKADGRSRTRAGGEDDMESERSEEEGRRTAEKESRNASVSGGGLLKNLEDDNNKTMSDARQRMGGILTPALMSLALPPWPFTPTALRNRSTDVLASYAAHIDPAVLRKMREEWHPLHAAQYVFIKGHLQNLLLTHLGDRGEMGHGVEGRTPFLDHKLTEYVDSLPAGVKIRWCEGWSGVGDGDGDGKGEGEGMETRKGKGEWVEKWLLREVGREFVRPEVYRRKKHPYSAPVRWRRGGELYGFIKGLVTREAVEKLGFLRGEGVEDVVERAFGSEDGSGFGDKMAFRLIICLAQWVVLMRRFGVKRFVS